MHYLALLLRVCTSAGTEYAGPVALVRDVWDDFNNHDPVATPSGNLRTAPIIL